MKKNILGLSSVEFILFTVIVFILGVVVKQFYIDTALKPDSQLAIETSYKDIEKEYKEGGSNKLKLENASKRFLAWQSALPEAHPVAENFVCEMYMVSGGSKLTCKEQGITYHLRLARDQSALLFGLVEDDRIYFCGKIQKEDSFTIWGGVTDPEIPVWAAEVATEKGKACAASDVAVRSKATVKEPEVAIQSAEDAVLKPDLSKLLKNFSVSSDLRILANTYGKSCDYATPLALAATGNGGYEFKMKCELYENGELLVWENVDSEKRVDVRLMSDQADGPINLIEVTSVTPSSIAPPSVLGKETQTIECDSFGAASGGQRLLRVTLGKAGDLSYLGPVSMLYEWSGGSGGNWATIYLARSASDAKQANGKDGYMDAVKVGELFDDEPADGKRCE